MLTGSLLLSLLVPLLIGGSVVVYTLVQRATLSIEGSGPSVLDRLDDALLDAIARLRDVLPSHRGEA